jgi:hypothetical protein
MQYMLLIYTPADTPRDASTYTAYMAFTEELQASGQMVAGDGLEGLDAATTVRVRDDETLLTDGPFAETKEMLAGYYLVDVPDLDAALGWAAKIPGAAFGSIEVRPVMVYDRA